MLRSVPAPLGRFDQYGEKRAGGSRKSLCMLDVYYRSHPTRQTGALAPAAPYTNSAGSNLRNLHVVRQLTYSEVEIQPGNYVSCSESSVEGQSFSSPQLADDDIIHLFTR